MNILHQKSDSKSNAKQSVPITSMREQHLREAHALKIQLDYVISFEDFKSNFKKLTGSAFDALFAALDGHNVVGWIHLKVQQRLQDVNMLEVVALVVDKECRGKGIGRSMVEHAEEHAKKLGLEHIILFSNIKNTHAHTFYEKVGFENKKTSKWFIKTLPCS